MRELKVVDLWKLANSFADELSFADSDYQFDHHVCDYRIFVSNEHERKIDETLFRRSAIHLVER